MKKVFKQTKHSREDWTDYNNEDFDWDIAYTGQIKGVEEAMDKMEDENIEIEDIEIYDIGEESYGDGDETYYGREETYEDGDEAYYGEEESYEDGDETYYSDEAYIDGDEIYYTGELDFDPEADYAGETAYAEDDEVYYDEELEYMDEEYPERELDEERKENIFLAIWHKILGMEPFDKMVLATGVAVVVLAVVTGGIFLSSRSVDKQISEFASVGRQLDGITMIGEKGLLAVADAELARIAAANAVVEEEEPNDYNEAEFSDEVTIKLDMTSVMKDLKIKFTNKDTGKLVANVPFTVTVTRPGGKSETWTDDDKDGIIYKKNIDAGTYKVSVNALDSEKYKMYTLPTAEQSVEVKKDIAYKKIDVSNEVKTEAEIDVSKEDTKVNGTQVESTLTDTVEWVESTVVATTYTEVPKNTIPDPKTLAFDMRFMRMSAVSGNEPPTPPAPTNKAFTIAASTTAAKMTIGKQASVKITASGYTEGASIRYTIATANAGVATAAVDTAGNVTISGVAAGTTKLTVSADYASGDSVPSNTVVIDVTVTNKKTITLDKTTATVYLTEPLVINAKITDDTASVALSAATSDSNVATVAASGRAITINGVKAGTATITVTYQENGEETKASCTVTVKEHPKNDKSKFLKDASGNQLYVMENNTYREAYYADYYTATQFFIKGDAKYTGWQTIDGKVYYFNANGQKMTGEQIIQGAKYNFASDGSLVVGSNGTMGIDVSKWNGTIDWNAVKNSGVSYVIIRCGYRGSSQGMLVEDPKFTSNIKGATAAGLKVGVYFFTQAVDEVEAVEEASYVLDKIKNYKISYPVFLDVESSGGRADKIDKNTRTAVCKAFCETIRNGGYTSGIYANKTWLNEKIDAGALSAYKIWLAQYAAAPTYTGRYDMWQYKSTGKVSGISGNVDMNLSYLGY